MNNFKPLNRRVAQQKIGFLLVEDFTLLSLSSAIDPLRIANLLTDQCLYEWTLIGGAEAGSVTSSDGVCVALDRDLDDTTYYDLVVVVGGINIEQHISKGDIQWLRKQARAGTKLGAACTGSYVLAAAGLLDGHQCSVHWDCLTPMAEQFPDVLCNSQIYTIDTDRLTASGGAVSLHMMLAYIGLMHPEALVEAVADMLVCDRHRAGYEPQVVPMWSRRVALKPKLTEVLQLMEANLEEPIPLSELARLVGLSVRQLERLFLQNLHCTPSRHYLMLRLQRARRLIKQSSRSIVEITAMCGFTSTTHFSRCYRKYMGVSPRTDRKQGTTDMRLVSTTAANG